MGTTGRISKNISYRTIGTVPPFKQSSWKLNEVFKLSKKRSNEHVSAEIHVSYLFLCVESGYFTMSCYIFKTTSNITWSLCGFYSLGWYSPHFLLCFTSCCQVIVTQAMDIKLKVMSIASLSLKVSIAYIFNGGTHALNNRFNWTNDL